MDVHRGTDRALTSALELHGIHVRFGAVHALAGASLVVRTGTVHALLGENGAGKTTLMRVAFGAVPPDAGTIVVHGNEVSLSSPGDALRVGIGMVHQHFTLVPAMTVAENVALGTRAGWRFDPRRAGDRVRALGRDTGLDLPPDARVSTLGMAARQRLEIVKALARDAGILILDEPTAVLSPLESEDLLRWLRGMADGGRTVILITHKLRDAIAIADDVTVLRRGHTVLAQPASAVAAATLAAAMLGESDIALPSDATADFGRRSDRPVIVARDLHVHDDHGVARVRDATFTAAAGEIIGVAAVEGSGHRELLGALARRRPPAAGTLALPREIGYVPEDRHHEALALDLSLTENVALRGAGARRGLMRWRALAIHTQNLMTRHDVRAPDAHVAVRTLSGGNQQKVVLARELDGSPAVLIVENPTRGLDLRATEMVHEQLREAARRGTTVVLYASDVDEMLSLAHRVLVVHHGTVREMPRDRAAIGAAMLGLVT